MNILITGLPLSGKSVLRRRIVTAFMRDQVPFWQHDTATVVSDRKGVDAISPLRASEVEAVFLYNDHCLVVEDAHVVNPQKAFKPPLAYDLIIYVEAGCFSYFMFWLSRAKKWFNQGHFDWDASIAWSGTGKPRDWHNLLDIISHLFRISFLRRHWLTADEDQLFQVGIPMRVVHSFWTPRGPHFDLEL